MSYGAALVRRAFFGWPLRTPSPPAAPAVLGGAAIFEAASPARRQCRRLARRCWAPVLVVPHAFELVRPHLLVCGAFSSRHARSIAWRAAGMRASFHAAAAPRTWHQLVPARSPQSLGNAIPSVITACAASPRCNQLAHFNECGNCGARAANDAARKPGVCAQPMNSLVAGAATHANPLMGVTRQPPTAAAQVSYGSCHAGSSGHRGSRIRF